MKIKKIRLKPPGFKRIFLSLLISYILLVLIGSGAIYYVYIEDTETAINWMIQRISDDITYANGGWDNATYMSDSAIPGRFRVSIFTTDGAVIERWRPIAGFLDTSDFKRLMEYEKPQTVQAITNQEWRMYSKPIKNKNNDTIGVITTSYFAPSESTINEIDKKLEDVATYVSKLIIVDNDEINAEKVSSRLTPYDISFQIVDQYNRIVYKDRNANSNNQTPDFIDPSYVKKEIHNTSPRQIQDGNSGNRILVISKPIINGNNTPVGVIVVGTTIESLYTILKGYFLVVTLGIIPISFGIWIIISRYITKHSSKGIQTKLLKASEVKRIVFSKHDGTLQINEHTIQMTYATNQYYMCLTLFSSPKKKWENDELLEKFGEENSKNGWRKVYDAMSAINSKTAGYMTEKLIVIDNKTYKINPLLVNKITKSSLRNVHQQQI